MHTLAIPEDYALVLQQVNESGEEDFSNLAESLQLDRKRLTHVLQSLHNKGLVKISHTAQDAWISLTSRGERLMASLWPESNTQYA